MTRAQRDARIIRARGHGWTYARIAARYGVTRQRAWQIVQESLPPHDHSIEPGELNRRGCTRCQIVTKAGKA